MAEGEQAKREKAAAMASRCFASFPSVDPIASDEILQLLRQTKQVVKPVDSSSSAAASPTAVWLVDVRSSPEREVSFIPHSVSKDTFEQQLKRMDEDQRRDAQANWLVVPYCTVGYRSGAYAEQLQRRGFANVRNGEGILLWTYLRDSDAQLVRGEYSDDAAYSNTSGGEVSSTVAAADSVHTFASMWNLASDRYRPVLFNYWELMLLPLKQALGWA